MNLILFRVWIFESLGYTVSPSPHHSETREKVFPNVLIQMWPEILSPITNSTWIALTLDWVVPRVQVKYPLGENSGISKDIFLCPNNFLGATDVYIWYFLARDVIWFDMALYRELYVVCHTLMYIHEL